MHARLVLIIALAWCSLGGAAELASAPVRSAQGGELYVAEGVVEAVRQSVISPQVSGRVTELRVKAGDRVRKGQLLARIDSQAAAQQAAASNAQVAAARAQLELARREYERQQQLFNKQYISQAALEQANAQYKATAAGVQGLLAQAGAANTQTGFFILSAPYDAVVADVQAALGDMAMPGKPLMTLYDPAALRVLASVPQSRAAQLKDGVRVRIELPGMPQAQRQQVTSELTVLPSADPVSHSQQVRLGLPSGARGAVPGMFARAYFPLAAEGGGRLMIPSSAVLRRSELIAVYVIGIGGKAMLRQVRLGRAVGDEVEALSGLSAGERVALDPVMAARR